jgi:hypothetical protein
MSSFRDLRPRWSLSTSRVKGLHPHWPISSASVLDEAMSAIRLTVEDAMDMATDGVMDTPETRVTIFLSTDADRMAITPDTRTVTDTATAMGIEDTPGGIREILCIRPIGTTATTVRIQPGDTRHTDSGFSDHTAGKLSWIGHCRNYGLTRHIFGSWQSSPWFLTMPLKPQPISSCGNGSRARMWCFRSKTTSRASNQKTLTQSAERGYTS